MSEERPFEEEDAAEAAPQIPNAAESGHHRRIRRKSRDEEAKSAGFWAAVFDSETGRREMWDVLSLTGFLTDRLAVTPAGHPDALASYQYLGQHRIGRQLFLSWLRRAPDGLLKMLSENHPDLMPQEKPPKARQHMEPWPVFPDGRR